MKYAHHVSAPTQREPILGREAEMIPNAAGGFVFRIDDRQRLTRFLILGCEGGTYYEGEKKLTVENAQTVLRLVKSDGPATVAEIVRVSDAGLAPKNDAAIFALALASVHGDEATKRAVYQALPKVCRIGTHLFAFAATREALKGGWGKGLRRAVGRWYTGRSFPSLVTQALKYQQRDGWSHRDLLRLAHPKLAEDDVKTRAVFDAICRPEKWGSVDSALAQAYVELKSADVKRAAKIISEWKVPRELVPTDLLQHAEVWAALLEDMPVGALVRNLGNLSKNGVVTPLSAGSKRACAILTDVEKVGASRVHPFAVLLGAKVYASGKSVKGKGEWTVVPQVLEALDEAFDLAFGNVTPTGKNFVLGVDISGSMAQGGFGGGTPLLGGAMQPREAAAAMALITARVEPSYFIGGFTTTFRDLGITSKDTIASVLKKTANQPHGGTDTSVAIQHALREKIPADVFVVYTDNETWAGDAHTSLALAQYRKVTQLPAKLAVVAFTATNRTVRDVTDPGSLDFVGLDASLPQALSAFAQL